MVSGTPPKFRPHGVVGARGFEPPTPASRTQYSTRLSYAPSLSYYLSYYLSCYNYYFDSYYYQPDGAQCCQILLLILFAAFFTFTIDSSDLSEPPSLIMCQ